MCAVLDKFGRAPLALAADARQAKIARAALRLPLAVLLRPCRVAPRLAAARLRHLARARAVRARRRRHRRRYRWRRGCQHGRRRSRRPHLPCKRCDAQGPHRCAASRKVARAIESLDLHAACGRTSCTRPSARPHTLSPSVAVGSVTVRDLRPPDIEPDTRRSLLFTLYAQAPMRVFRDSTPRLAAARVRCGRVQVGDVRWLCLSVLCPLRSGWPLDSRGCFAQPQSMIVHISVDISVSTTRADQR